MDKLNILNFDNVWRNFEKFFIDYYMRIMDAKYFFFISRGEENLLTRDQ